MWLGHYLKKENWKTWITQATQNQSMLRAQMGEHMAQEKWQGKHMGEGEVIRGAVCGCSPLVNK